MRTRRGRFSDIQRRDARGVLCNARGQDHRVDPCALFSGCSSTIANSFAKFSPSGFGISSTWRSRQAAISRQKRSASCGLLDSPRFRARDIFPPLRPAATFAGFFNRGNGVFIRPPSSLNRQFHHLLHTTCLNRFPIWNLPHLPARPLRRYFLRVSHR